jgi:hypothetical protein
METRTRNTHAMHALTLHVLSVCVCTRAHTHIHTHSFYLDSHVTLLRNRNSGDFFGREGGREVGNG